MGRKTTIYGLLCPIKKEIVYVGRSRDLRTRLQTHRTVKKPVACLLEWLQTLESKGIRKEIQAVVLEVTETGGCARERHWTRELGKTHTLLNIHNKLQAIDITGIMDAAEYERISGKTIQSKLKAA